MDNQHRILAVEDLFRGSLDSCSVHPREEMHFINASQLANAIARANIPGLGKQEKFIGADAAQFYPKIFGRTGIIYIQDYWHRSTDQGRATGDHIDVWNGYRSSAKVMKNVLRCPAPGGPVALHHRPKSKVVHDNAHRQKAA